MLQRPGCFVFYVLAAFIGLAMFIGWVNETRASATTPTSFADAQQNVAAVVAPTASATLPATVDTFARLPRIAATPRFSANEVRRGDALK